MFTPEERDRIREDILAVARADARVGGGAITGSFAAGREDRWSDIDLAFGIRPGSDHFEGAIADFTLRMEDTWGAVTMLDVASGPWLYRVFLLPNTLQVDLAFVTFAEFGATAPTFQLVFGEAATLPEPAPPDAEAMCGWAWLYALHLRSALARGNIFQAEYMLGAMRNQALALACLRNGLPTRDGRGFDRLPAEVLDHLPPTFPVGISYDELLTAFRAVMALLQSEIAPVDRDLAMRLKPVLDGLVAGLGRPGPSI